MPNFDIIKTKPGKKQSDASGSVIDEAVKYIRSRYQINYNVFLNQYGIKQKKGKKIAEISKHDLRLILRSAGIAISQPDLNAILKSDFADFKVADQFNPVRSYLDEIKGKYKGESHIDMLAAYIKPRAFDDNTQEYYTEFFRKYFKKWFVSMVATALGLTKNDVMFIIVQAKGGTGKTEFVKFLTKIEELAFYTKTITKNNYQTNIPKEITRNLLIIFDELAALKPAYLDAFKSEISMDDIKTKHSYSTDEIILPRLGSFAGTSNFTQEKGGFIPINDGGLMRRFFTVENTCKIDWQSYTKKVSLEQMYAEAMMLIEASNFDYNFNNEDYELFETYNKRYLKTLDLSDIIKQRYKPGVNGHSEFKTASDIETELLAENYPPSLISPEQIGRALNGMGFTQTSKRVGEEKEARKVYQVEPVQKN